MSDIVKDDEQTITVTVTGKDLDFVITRNAYNKYINAMLPTNKITPSHNFLVGVVDVESREDLLSILNSIPGSEIQIAGSLLEEYIPDLGIIVKKQKK